MSARRVVVIGCGGHGREVAAIVRAAGCDASGRELRVDGFADDGPTPEHRQRAEALGLPWLGPVEQVSGATSFVVGVSDPHDRRRLAARGSEAGLTPVSVVHPDATVAPEVQIAPGVVVWPGARISTQVRLGPHVHLNQNVTVGHDTTVEEIVTVNPQAAISGAVVLRARCTIGAGAVVLQGLHVGPGAVVGAAACVVRDVPAGSTVVGVPARPLAPSTGSSA